VIWNWFKSHAPTVETEQVPHGPDNRDCPWWKKPMSKVCHKCPLWSAVDGKDPQSEAIIKRWNCGLAWQNTLQVENSQMVYQLGAAIESLRNRHAELTDTVRQANGMLPLPRDGVDDIRTQRIGYDPEPEGK
jgi:hypothetical protein